MDRNERESVGFGEFRTGWPVVLAALFGIGLGLSPVPFYSIGMLAPELAKEFGWKFGAIMVGFINNGLNLLDMPSAFHPIATGLVILIALILNQGVSVPTVFRKWFSRPGTADALK